MAEWAAKLLLEPLISAVSEKASSYLLEQYQVMAGMKEQHAILKRRLPAILDVIVEAEENGAHKKGARAWLEVLKTVAYEANDVFDELKYEALRREAKKKGHYSILGMDVVSLFPAYNPIVFRYRMGKKLRRIVQAIEVLVAEMNAFGFQRVQKEDADKRRSIVKQLRQTDSFISDSKEGKTISRGKDKKEIVKWLLTNPDKMDLMVAPGKDAQSVYNDQRVKDHFQLRKWVYVSDDFDVDDIANKIIGATGNDCEKALDNLQKEVSGKRFLIVLDDIRKCDGFADKWAKLKTCLQEGGGGSAILTTTHDEEVTQIMCGTNKVRLLAELGKEEIIGREKEEIVKSLLSHADKRDLMVLPIFGLGGLGKTTLAQFVYNDRQVKDHFQLQKWVCVSDEFDVVELANKISGVDEKDREKALKELQEKVSRKRFLVVLDDIWKRDAFADKWAKLKTCLQEGGAGSAILITTRDKQVAEIMCGTDNFHRLAELKKEEIIGRDEEKKKNVKSLLSHADKRELMVLPIFGIGGLGKTTLAQLVYNDQQVKDHFQLQKWVFVPDEFDVVELANKISGVDEKDREKALKELQEKVSRKRFLVVLDDIWKRDAFADTWAKLKTCLQGGGAGSAILITTRDKQVAEIMCGTNEIYPLAGLKKDDLWEIF